MANKNNNADYLGDGVYIDYDGFEIRVSANDHRENFATDNIYLEPNIIAALVRYLKRMEIIK